MGQCAPSSIDDDETIFVLGQANRGGCHGDLPLHKTKLRNGDGIDTCNYLQSLAGNHEEDKHPRHFLQPHQPDIQRRCIVDQSKIKRAIWLQSDELLRCNGRLKMNGISAGELWGQDLKEPYHGVSSVGALSIVSGITSTSNTTFVRKNTIRNRCDENNEAIGIYTEIHYGPSSQLSNEKTKHSQSGQDMKTQQSYIPEQQTCVPVLRIKMRAHLGWFYTQHYLKMFPIETQAIIGTLPQKDKWIPDLKCVSSDGSFSSNDSSRSDETHYVKNGPMQPMTPIKCPITNESLLDLAITGCLGLLPREQDHKALRSSRRQMKDCSEKIPDHCIVLINKGLGSPLAVCVLKETLGSPIVHIYSTKQMTFAQKHETTTRQLGLDWADDIELYAWAEVKTEGEFPEMMNFDIFMARRFDGCFSSQPCYSACFNGRAIEDRLAFRSPIMKMVGRTENERHTSGCALFWMESNKTMSLDRSEESPEVSFRINIAQGIDPALLICFTSIVDEILESSMRRRCRTQARGRIRNDSFSLTKERLRARSQQQRIVDGISCYREHCLYSNCKF